MAAPIPSFADNLQFYIGVWGAGRSTAGSHTIDLCDFPVLPGATSPVQFTPADVGCPIMIVGAGPVDPLMPVIYQVQGGTLASVITAYNSPTSVEIADAATTYYYNSGYRTVCVLRPCGMRVDNWGYQSSIAPGTRDSLTVQVLRADPYFIRNEVVVEGQPIFLGSSDPDVGDIIGGLIDTIVVSNQSQPGSGGGLNAATNAAGAEPFSYTFHCASWDSIPSRRRVHPEAATVLTGTLKNVFTRIALRSLIDEGVSVVFAEDGPTISIPAPAGAVITDLFDQACTLAGDATDSWHWKFDAWRNVIVSKRTATAAPWNVDDSLGSDSNVLVAVDVSRSHDGPLANTVYALGQQVLVGVLTTKFNGEAGKKAFNVAEPIGTEPVITLNGVVQTVGILSVESGKQWYWNQGSNAITQDPNSAAITAADLLVVISHSLNAALALAYNNAGLQERAVVEGPGGVYEDVFTVSDVTSPAELYNDANQYAIQRGKLPSTVTATTVKAGLKTGQLQHIRLADVAVDDDFLITQVKMGSNNNLLYWDYVAQAGYAVPEWLTAFTNFINRQRNTGGLTVPSNPIVGAYQQTRTITIDHTQVGGSADLMDFVFLFRGTYADLANTGHGGFVTSTSGYDIVFTDSLGNLLDFQLAHYDQVTGAVVFWIRIPVLSYTADTNVILLFGDSAVTTYQGNDAGTWSPAVDIFNVVNQNFHGVYGLTEATGPYGDVTQYANDSTAALTAYPSLVAGPINEAQSFTASHGIKLTDTLLNANGDAFHLNSNATFSCWMKSSGQTGASGWMIANQDSPGARGAGIGLRTSGKAFLDVCNWPLGDHPVDSPATVCDGAWHLIHGAVDPTSGILYVDGVPVATTDGIAFPFTFGEYSTLGDIYPGGGFFLSGALLAEVHITQTKLTAGWILTEYHNQKAGSTFYSIAGGATDVVVNGNPQGTVTNTAGVLTADLPVFGNGAADVKVGTKTGNTNKVATSSASGTVGQPVLWDASSNVKAGVVGQLVPAGGAAGKVLTKASGTDYDADWELSESDVLVDGASTLNVVKVNGVQVWAGQTDFLFDGA